MGKVEALTVIATVAGLWSAQSTDPPLEAQQIRTLETIIGMSRPQFASWCGDKRSSSGRIFESNGERSAACSWVDPENGAVWHTMLHFDAGASTAHQADSGLLGASPETVLRLVHNEHGADDGRSMDGLTVWKVDLAGREGFLAVADYDEITVVRFKSSRGSGAIARRRHASKLRPLCRAAKPAG